MATFEDAIRALWDVNPQIPYKTGWGEAGFPAGVRLDLDDYIALRHYSWSLDGAGYVQRHAWTPDGRYTKVRLHRELMGHPEGWLVDHVNGDRLDHRRCNLRLVDHFGNAQNVGLSPRSTSGYRGVHQHGNRWRARGRLNGRRISLGCYASPEEAGAVAHQWRVENYPGYVDRR